MASNTNHVGSVVPTEAEQTQILADITSIATRLAAFGIILSVDQRSTFLKPRAGAEKYMALVAEIAKEKKVSIDGMSVDGIGNDLQVGNVAFRCEKLLADCLQLASDTRLTAYGEAWQSFLGYYGVLNSMASRDAALASRLRPAVEFMATGPRTKKPTDK